MRSNIAEAGYYFRRLMACFSVVLALLSFRNELNISCGVQVVGGAEHLVPSLPPQSGVEVVPYSRLEAQVSFIILHPC